MKCSARFGYSYAKQPTHPTTFLVSTPGETNLCKLKQLNTEKKFYWQEVSIFLYVLQEEGKKWESPHRRAH